jgi:hypothetical protein
MLNLMIQQQEQLPLQQNQSAAQQNSQLLEM